MPACIIFHSTITDPEAFTQYAKAVPATLTPFGGTLLTRGKKERVLTGEHPHTNVGILRFPDLNKAHAWYASEAYQALIPLRETGAEMTVVSYEEPSV